MDELVQILIRELNWDWTESHGVPSAEESMRPVAEAILAAGFRKLSDQDTQDEWLPVPLGRTAPTDARAVRHLTPGGLQYLPARAPRASQPPGPPRMNGITAIASGNVSGSAFAPTHRVRKVGTDEWTVVRADGREPQTYYDREGKTIYAGIWFRDMQVERLTPSSPTCEWCTEPAHGTAIQHNPPYAVRLSCGAHGNRFRPGPTPIDSGSVL